VRRLSSVSVGVVVAAGRFCQRTFSMRMGTLPAAYAARKGVQVIHRTGYLAKRPVRRAFETARSSASSLPTR
jgi:hypothetical protein